MRNASEKCHSSLAGAVGLDPTRVVHECQWLWIVYRITQESTVNELITYRRRVKNLLKYCSLSVMQWRHVLTCDESFHGLNLKNDSSLAEIRSLIPFKKSKVHATTWRHNDHLGFKISSDRRSWYQSTDSNRKDLVSPSPRRCWARYSYGFRTSVRVTRLLQPIHAYNVHYVYHLLDKTAVQDCVPEQK